MAPKRSRSLTIASTSSYRLTTQASNSGICNTGACSRNCPNNGQVSHVLRNTSIIDGCASACVCSVIRITPPPKFVVQPGPQHIPSSTSGHLMIQAGRLHGQEMQNAAYFPYGGNSGESGKQCSRPGSLSSSCLQYRR